MSTIASLGPLEADTTVFQAIGRPTRTGPTWLWVRHDLELATLRAARAELDALLSADEPPRFVLVYLGAERFVDVRGMRLLVDAARHARRRGSDLAVVAAPRCLRWMVARLGGGDELVLVPDARAAARWARVRSRP